MLYGNVHNLGKLATNYIITCLNQVVNQKLNLGLIRLKTVDRET